MKEVVRIAIMVPIGIDLWASLRSPDLLEPAIIPEINSSKRNSSIVTVRRVQIMGDTSVINPM